MMQVFISYLPPRRKFTAHHHSFNAEISAPSLGELRGAVRAAVRPEVKITFALSRAARAEQARRTPAFPS
jgi:hypothetical protein